MEEFGISSSQISPDGCNKDFLLSSHKFLLDQLFEEIIFNEAAVPQGSVNGPFSSLLW